MPKMLELRRKPVSLFAPHGEFFLGYFVVVDASFCRCDLLEQLVSLAEQLHETLSHKVTSGSITLLNGWREASSTPQALHYHYKIWCLASASRSSFIDPGLPM